MKKRILAILLALMMVLSMTPITTFADTTGTNVAKIGDAMYSSLEEAIKDADSTSTVQLLTNVDLGAKWLEITKPFTLDLNGCEISSSCKNYTLDICTTGFTITDSSPDRTGKVSNSSSYVICLEKYAGINIYGGTYDALNPKCYYAISGNTDTPVNVTDGHFNGNVQCIKSTAIFNISGGCFNGVFEYNATPDNVIITGGTFNFDPSNYDSDGDGDKVAENYVPDGYDVINNENGTWTVKKKVSAVAKIGTTEYATVEDAIGAAEDGDTITLLKDVTTPDALGDETYYNCITFGYVLNDYTDQLPGPPPSSAGKIGTFTIDGANHNISFGISDINPKLVESAIIDGTDVNLTIKYCNVNTVNDFALNHAVYDTTMTIESGSYTTTAEYGIALMAAGETTVTGGTFNGVCAVCAYSPVSISDGYFKGMIFDGSETASEYISITGGYYDSDVSAYVADGYECVALDATADADAFEAGYTHKVVEKTATNVAKIGDVEYETLQAAINAAKDGDVIELLKNTSENVTVAGKAVFIKETADTAEFTGNMDAECSTLTNNKGILYGDLKNAIAVVKLRNITPTYGTVLFFILKNITLDADIELPFYGNTNSALWYYGGISPENAVLDLNGHTISQGHGNDGGYWYGSVRVEYTNLTIKDSSKAQTGKITGYGSCVVVNATTECPATVTLESGTLSMIGDIPYGGNGIVQTQQAGQFIMQGGTIDGSAVANEKLVRGLFEFAFLNEGNGKGVVTISDGYFKTVAEGKRDTTRDGKYISPDGFLFNYYNDGTQPVITGGYFDFDPSDYVADGYECVALDATADAEAFEAGYLYKVQKKVSAVAKIGDVEYATLADAIAAVPKDGTETTITMIDNEVIDVSGTAVVVAANQKIVLDLNGYHVCGTCTTGKGSALITNNGTLTIKDSTDTEADGTGSGKLTYNANPTWEYDGTVNKSYASNLIYNYGTLTIESGYFENDTSGTGGAACYVVDDYAMLRDVSFTLKGGKLVNNKYTAVRFATNSETYKCTAVMQGGVIESLYSCVINYNNKTAPKADIKFCGTVVNGQSTTLYESSNTAQNINDWSNFKLSVEAGKFSGEDGEFVWMKAAQNFASGGYYKNLIDAKYIVPGYKCISTPETDPNHTEYPYTIVKAPSVAKIGDVKYETLAEAVAAAQDGDKIELLADIKLDQTVSVAKQITLDLGTFSITPADGGLTANAKTTKDALIAVNYGGDLTITGTTGKISSNDVASVYAAVKMTEKGEVAGAEPAILTVNGGTLEGYYYGITGNGNRHKTEITVNGGTVRGTKANDSAGIFNPQNGSLTVTGGTIEGAVGIYVKSGTVTTFTGGTIKGNGTKNNYVTTKDGFQQTGDAFVVDNCGYPGGEPAISITGSTFISEKADAVASYSGTGYEKITGFISGGFFSSDVQSLVANGYKTYPVAGNGMWTVGADDQAQKADTSKPIADVVTVAEEDDEEITLEVAQQKVQDTVNNNTAVNNFVNSDIKDATTSNAGHESTNLNLVKGELIKAVSEEDANKETVIEAIEKLENDIDLSSYVKVKTEAATVANFTIQSATTVTGTTVKSMTFDVKPYAEYTVKEGETVVETVTAVIPNSAITSPITFRLPVEDSVPVGTIVEVYHSETEVTEQNKGKFFGKYKVQEEGGKKFIELASDNFSYFTYELTEEVVGNATFAVTLNLADSIGIIMYVNNPTGTLNKYKVAATYKGDTRETQLSESLIKDGRPRIVIADCAAAEMFETVHVVITYDGITIKEFDYSVYNFCNAKINNKAETEELKELCRSALDYGCYAREYFKYDEMVPAAGSEDYIARGVSGVTASGSSATISGPCTGIKSVSATLSLESRTKIIFYLTPDTEYNAESYTYSVNGGDLVNATPAVSTDSNGRIRVEVSGIAAAKLDGVYTLTVTPIEGGSMKVNYSPMGYAQTKQYSTTKNLPELVKSLYVYGQQAKAYFINQA